MRTQDNKRHTHDYASVKIGTVFGGLTLKHKDDYNWLMRCACKMELTIKRHEILNGKRISCGIKCPERKILRRKKRKQNEIADMSVHLDIPGFKRVETRKRNDGSTWMIFRQFICPLPGVAVQSAEKQG